MTGTYRVNSPGDADKSNTTEGSKMNTTKQTEIEKELANMSLADLIREKRRLDEYLGAREHEDDDAADDRRDNVRDCVDTTIFKDTIKVNEVGRPVLNPAALDGLVEGSSGGDETLVREFVKGRYVNLVKWYEWYSAGTLVPRRPLKPRSVIAKLAHHGIPAVWEEDEGRGVWKITNPTHTQCVWIHTDTDTRGGTIDHIQLICNHDDDERTNMITKTRTMKWPGQ
jgi:hypothetical protein